MKYSEFSSKFLVHDFKKVMIKTQKQYDTDMGVDAFLQPNETNLRRNSRALCNLSETGTSFGAETVARVKSSVFTQSAYKCP